MHPISNQFHVRTDHVTGLSEPLKVVEKGEDHYEFEVYLVGGQTLTVSGTGLNMAKVSTALIRAVNAHLDYPK